MAKSAVRVNLNSQYDTILSDEVVAVLVNHLKEVGDSYVCPECYVVGRCEHLVRIPITQLLIESYIGLVCSLAGRFTYHDSQELVSVGLHAVCQGVADAPTKLIDTNLGAFINVRIFRAMQRFIQRNVSIIPVESRAYAKGERVLVGHFDSPTVHTNHLRFEMQDVMDKVTNTDHEKFIGLCMLEGGHTCEEMGVMIGKSGAWAQRLQSRIKKRIAEVWEI